MRALATSALAIAAIVAPASGLAQTKDWTKTVVQSSSNGFVLGNPDAPVKLVEYASLTCPHCAHFSQEASNPLKDYVRKGQVSYEFRNYVLNGVDLTATLLAHCAETPSFFPFVEDVFATQQSWVSKISGLSSAEKDKLKNLPEAQRMPALAKAGGLLQTAAKHGVPQAKAERCLADAALIDRLTALREAGAAAGVRGTPTFFLNGERLPVNDWSGVDAAIRKAMGERG